MVLFELGILQNGVMIFEKLFYELNNLNQISDVIKGQFFDAIFNMTKMSLKGQIHSLNFKKYQIIFEEINQPIDNEKITNDFLIYAIGDRKLNTKYAKTLINRVISAFVLGYNKLDSKSKRFAIKLPKGCDFDKEVDVIVGDFFRSSLDRIMKLHF